MPNRWIKEAYLASSRINAASAEARDLWIRLLVTADDHGLFHAAPQLVASRCFPLAPDARKCARLLTELEGVHLIERYEVAGRSYLRICQWYERPRSAPKYPPPGTTLADKPDDLTRREQLQASASNGEQAQANASPHARARLTSTSTTTITTTSTTHPSGAGARTRATTPTGGRSTVVITEPEPAHRAQATQLGLDADEQYAAYRDYHAAKGRRDKDEAAGFRNWLRKAAEFAGKRGNGKARPPTLAEQRAEGFAAICGRGENGNGRDIIGTAERVDRATVHPLPLDLRQQGRDDVGESRPDGPVANVGG